MFQETRKHDVFFLKCIDLYWLMMCCVVFLQFSWVRVLHVLWADSTKKHQHSQDLKPYKIVPEHMLLRICQDYGLRQLSTPPWFLPFKAARDIKTTLQNKQFNKNISIIANITDIAANWQSKSSGILCFVLTSLTGGIQNVMAFFGVNDATDVARLQSVWTKLIQIAWAWCSRCWCVFCLVKFWFCEYYGNSDLLRKRDPKTRFYKTLLLLLLYFDL